MRKSRVLEVRTQSLKVFKKEFRTSKLHFNVLSIHLAHFDLDEFQLSLLLCAS